MIWKETPPTLLWIFFSVYDECIFLVECVLKSTSLEKGKQRKIWHKIERNKDIFHEVFKKEMKKEEC
jgi:hypothetical protein